jgi:hypothetical protein
MPNMANLMERLALRPCLIVKPGAARRSDSDKDSQKFIPTRSALLPVDKMNPNTRACGGFARHNTAKFLQLQGYPHPKSS